MHHNHHMVRYEDRFSGKLFEAPEMKTNEGIWCLKLNDELLVRGTSNWKDGGDLSRVKDRLKQGDVLGDSGGGWVEGFFDHHIRPVIEASTTPINFHPADIPKACAEFWNINCVFSYEKIDTRHDQWWKSLQRDGPFEDVRELEGDGRIHGYVNFRKNFYDPFNKFYED